jgi:hypothetical protein
LILGDPDHPPFVIGYFKEELYDDDVDHDKTTNSNVYLNARALFTKSFVMMKHPKVRPKGVDDDF